MQSRQTIKATKLYIVKNKALVGGLATTKQRYSICYLFPIVENNILKYPQKISIEHCIEKEGTTPRLLSLRFHNSLFLKEFIFEVVKAYAIFEKKQHPSMTPFSTEGNVFHKNKIMELLKGVNDSYKENLLEKG